MLLPAIHVHAQELTVFFGNLHSHTSYSDGRGTPNDAYTHARDIASLDFLAITEHNHAGAGDIADNPALYNGTDPMSLRSAAQSFTQPGEFVAIYGQEFSTISSGNHANVFEVPEVIATSVVPNGRWDILLDEWIPAHPDDQGQPALLLLNHPATSNSPTHLEYGLDDFGGSLRAWVAALDAHAQLINIINGPSHDRREPGRPSESEYLRYLNLGFHLAPTADQDNHRRNWGSAAETRTGVIATRLDKPEILAALRSRHVYASQDRNLSIIPRVSGHLIGTVVEMAEVPPANTRLAISVVINDPDEPWAEYDIDVFSDQVGGNEDANVVHTTVATGNGTVSIDDLIYEGGHQYVFLRITQRNDEDSDGDMVWTAPVWFKGDVIDESANGLPSVSLEVDLVRERAEVVNIGGAPVNLRQWMLTSVRGNQVFTFPDRDIELGPGQSAVVVSGKTTANIAEGEFDWPGNANVWHNAGDRGELRDSAGDILATDP